MLTATESELVQKNCKPCEGGAEPASPAEAREQVEKLPGWTLSGDGNRIRKAWVMKDFAAAIRFFNAVAQIAESEDHHPDLHLTGYRNVAIELSTHAIGGLSENDFILAAKIDQAPVELKK
jgi:4a-hydroxytetrahydrobiopterin dehydratase